MQFILPRHMPFTQMSVTALDGSRTEMGHSDTVNRDGLNADDIGNGIMRACEDLLTGLGNNATIEDVGDILVRFSHDT